MSEPTKAELLEEIQRLEMETARRLAWEAGKRHGRAIAEIGRVYETRIDCTTMPERVRRAA